MTNLDSILKSRDITLPKKAHLVKAMVFPVVMYGYESWTIKKSEYQIIDAFELWYWRRLLRLPWTARRSNQSILKEISLGCSLEGLMLKLKLQYFDHLMRQTDSYKRLWCWERLKAGGEVDSRGWDGWWHRRLDGRVWLNSRSCWWTEKPGMVLPMGSQRVGHDWGTELNWTESRLWFFSSHVWMWELNYKESWVPKNWCFWTVVLEKTLETPLDCKEIQPVHPKGVQSWVFIGRTDAEAETPILWPPDAKNWPIGKDPDAGKDWRQEEKG